MKFKEACLLYEVTEHEPKIGMNQRLGGMLAQHILSLLQQGVDGGKKAAKYVKQALDAGEVSVNQIEDTFGNAIMGFTNYRYRKPEIGEPLQKQAQAGYDAFKQELKFS